MVGKQQEPENLKLLSLIDDWIANDGKGNTYENVVLELLNGQSNLYVQIYDQVIGTREFIADENTKLKLGIHEIKGKKYFGAFTSLELLANWMKIKGSYAKIPSADLLEMADKTDLNGVVINSGYKNMFAVFINKN